MRAARTCGANNNDFSILDYVRGILKRTCNYP